MTYSNVYDICVCLHRKHFHCSVKAQHLSVLLFRMILLTTQNKTDVDVLCFAEL